MASTVSTVVNALNLFTRKKLGKVQLEVPHAVGFNDVTKMVMPEGEGYRVPIFQSGGAVSHDFGNAQTYGADPTIKRFFLQSNNLIDYFRVLQLTNKALKTMETNTERHIKDLLGSAKDSTEQVVLEIEREFWGDGYCSLGTVNGAPNASDFTISPVSNAKYFRPGMGIQASATIGGVLIDSSAIATVLSSNPFTGKITLSAALSGTLASLADTNFIFPVGNAAANSTRKGMHGVAWWAETPVGSEDFIGVDRSTAPHVYAFQQATGSTSDKQGAIIDADAAAFDVNGTARTCIYMNPRDLADLADTANTQTNYSPANKVTVSHGDVSVQCTSGNLPCKRSPFIPQNKIYILNVPSLELVHLPKLPVNIDNFDGQMAMKLASSAGQEIRIESYLDLISTSPGSNVMLTLS